MEYTKVIAFDEKQEKLKLINYYEIDKNKSIKRYVFEFEAGKEWECINESVGYSWFLNSKDIINKIESNLPIEEDLFKKCKDLQKNIHIEDNFEIKSQEDINNLYVLTSFHDSFVEKLIIENDSISLLLNTTWGCKINFSLKGNPKTNLDKIEKFYFVENSCMFFEEGFTYWVDNDTVKSKKQIKAEDKYFCAEKVSYKVEIY